LAHSLCGEFLASSEDNSGRCDNLITRSTSTGTSTNSEKIVGTRLGITTGTSSTGHVSQLEDICCAFGGECGQPQQFWATRMRLDGAIAARHCCSHMRARDTEKSEVLLVELETTRVSATRGRLRRGNLHTTLLLRNALVAQRSQQTLANTSTWTGCQENNSQLLPIPSVCRDTSWRLHMLKCIPYWRSILTKQGNAHLKRSSNYQPLDRHVQHDVRGCSTVTVARNKKAEHSQHDDRPWCSKVIRRQNRYACSVDVQLCSRMNHTRRTPTQARNRSTTVVLDQWERTALRPLLMR